MLEKEDYLMDNVFEKELNQGFKNDFIELLIKAFNQRAEDLRDQDKHQECIV